MSGSEITPKEALSRLGTSTAEAIEEVLATWAPGSKRGEVTVLKDGESPFAKLSPGTIASSVSYVDGVSGANIFLLTPAGARKLAEAMGVPPAEDAEETEISELELSAVAEVANQTMAAAAAAIGGVLGHEIEISPPDTRVLANPAEAADIFGKTPHATSTTFLVGGETCRLIQLVPNSFVVRMVKAMDEMDMVERSARRRRVPGDLRAAGGHRPHQAARVGRARPHPDAARAGAHAAAGRRDRPRRGRRRAREAVRQRHRLRPRPPRGPGW